MAWHTPLQRLRLVGTLALVLGAAACISVLATHGLGYAPDTSVAPLFNALWPIGIVLALLGALIWVGIWILHGSGSSLSK